MDLIGDDSFISEPFSDDDMFSYDDPDSTFLVDDSSEVSVPAVSPLLDGDELVDEAEDLDLITQ